MDDICKLCRNSIESTSFLYRSRHTYCITCYDKLYKRALRFVMRRRGFPAAHQYLSDRLTVDRPVRAA